VQGAGCRVQGAGFRVQVGYLPCTRPAVGRAASVAPPAVTLSALFLSRALSVYVSLALTLSLRLSVSLALTLSLCLYLSVSLPCTRPAVAAVPPAGPCFRDYFFFFFTLVTGRRRSLSLKLSDTRVYEPQIRARLGTSRHPGRLRRPSCRVSGFKAHCSTLESTQGQIDGFFGQLPYKCHQNRVASVGY